MFSVCFCFVSIRFLKILLEYSLFTMLCLFPLHSKVNQLYSHIYSDFPGGSDCNEFACKSGDPYSVPGLGRSPGEVNVYPIQYSCLENSMDKETWQGYISQGHKKLNMTVWLTLSLFFFHTYIHFLGGFFSHTGHYRVLSRAPCDTQLVLISYLFYIWRCVFVSPTLPVYPTPHHPLSPWYKFLFYICDSISVL